jgi:hypothetical protein
MASIKDFSANTYSQNGEDGIIAEVFRRICIEQGKACEFGSADGYWMSNIRALMDKGWEGVQLEAKKGQFVTPENINDLVPDTLDLLSIDIDGNDYACWQAYTGSAKVVIIEINSGKDPNADSFTADTGANFSVMLRLAHSKGYKLIAHTGNMIFVQGHYAYLFPDADTTFDTRWL